MAVPLLEAWTDWECPACGAEERTPAMPANADRLHNCPKLHGLIAPMVRAGTDCKLVASRREDYLGDEAQRTGDDGKPYMNVTTVHADGHTDLAVFSPVARGYL